MKTQLPEFPAWDNAVASYSAYLKISAMPKTTIKLRGYQLRRLGFETQLEPFKISADDLEQFFAAQSWSANTRRSYRTTFKSFYAWARIKNHIVADPAANLPKVPAPIGIPRPADDLALQAGLSRADSRVIQMIRLGAEAGLRASEIARVHREHLEKDLLGYSLRVLGKGNKTRLIPISDSLALMIRSADNWLFPGQENGHLSGAYVSKLISRALPKGVTAHMLRHRFGTRAYQGSGGDIRAVQELLGHSSVATTQIYTAVSEQAKRRAALSAA